MGRLIRSAVPIAVFLIGFQFSLSGQFLPRSGSDRRSDPAISFVVRDSLSGDPLPGAVISIVSGRDTLNLVSDRGGHAVVKSSELPDAAVTVITSFIGYRTRKDSLGTDSRTDIHVSVGMQEVPMVLNSAVVRGDAVAMVMHGDTTVFNAAAFRTK